MVGGHIHGGIGFVETHEGDENEKAAGQQREADELVDEPPRPGLDMIAAKDGVACAHVRLRLKAILSFRHGLNPR